ncbi:PP2A regulatory subunit TAP46 [Chlorella vulgaris]
MDSATSDDRSLQDLPLPALFQRGRTLLKQLQDLPAGPGTQQLVQQAAACWTAAATAADALALFSANEDLEDLATADIKYLLIPFYRAEVLSHTHGDDPSVRLAALSSASQHYRTFLHHCRQYGLLSPPAAALAAVALRQGQGGSSSSSGPAMDAASMRQNKIEKFKREKFIKGRLEELEQRQATEGQGAGEGSGDEEEQREVWMLQADLAALQAAEGLSSMQQEVDILKHAASIPEEQRERQRQQRQQSGPPPDLLRQLQAAAGSLGGVGGKRGVLAGEVFRPSHVLPTMSIEQFGEVEYRRMLEQQQREAATKERQERRQAERGADDIEEEELYRQRAMDEFKDDNPRGWGNSKLRPCS